MAVRVVVLSLWVGAVGSLPPAPDSLAPVSARWQAGRMGVGMSWGALGVGQAWGEYPSVDECARALCRSVRRSLARMGPDFRGCILKHSAHVLRVDMCTEGLHAVSHGKRWHSEHGTAWVALYPRGGGEHEETPHRPELGR
jgi:hypothetical protein